MEKRRLCLNSDLSGEKYNIVIPQELIQKGEYSETDKCFLIIGLKKNTIHGRRIYNVDSYTTPKLQIYKNFHPDLKMKLRMYQDTDDSQYNNKYEYYDDHGLITGSTAVGTIYDESCNYETDNGVILNKVKYSRFSLEFYMPTHYFLPDYTRYSFWIPRNPILSADIVSDLRSMVKIEEKCPIIPPTDLYKIDKIEEKPSGEQKMYKYVLKNPDLKPTISPTYGYVFINDDLSSIKKEIESFRGGGSYYLGKCNVLKYYEMKEKFFLTIFSDSNLQGGSHKSKKKSSIRMKKRISKKKINKTSKNLRKKKNKKYISKRRGI